MNNNSLIKKELLRRKIVEYFSKNPKAKTVVVSIGEGKHKTSWKVAKQAKSFNIIEVATKTENFVIEQDPAAPAQAVGTTPTTPTQVPQGAQAAQTHNIEAFKQTDFNSKLQMLGSVVPLTGDTVAIAFADLLKPGSAQQVALLRQTVERNAASVTDQNARRSVGSALGFLSTLGNQGTLMSHKKSNKPLVREELLKEVPMASPSSPLQPEEPEDPIGLEKQPQMDTPPEESQPESPDTRPEDAVVGKSLEGHTINGAKLETKPAGGSLTLDLVATQNPARIEWDNSGKVNFHFKGRKHVVQNGRS